MRRYLGLSESIQHAVIIQVLEGKLTISEALGRLGVSRTTLWRKSKRFRQYGALGLVHKGTGKPSNACLDPLVKEVVLSLWQKEFAPYCFGVRHFYRKAKHRFPKPLSYKTVLNWLKSAVSFHCSFHDKHVA